MTESTESCSSPSEIASKIDQGQKLIAARQFKRALKLFQTLRNRVLSERIPEEQRAKVSANVSLGYELCQLHLRLPVENSDEGLQSALAFFRSQDAHDKEAWALICLGIRAQSESDFDAAVAFLNDAARLAEDCGDREAEARALLDMATMLGYRRKEGDSERMEQAFSKGYSLAQMGDAYEKAVAEATRGIVQYTLGHFDESIAGYEAACMLFDSVAMPEQALETSVALGVALYRSGMRKEAAARFRKTARRGRTLKRNTETGVALMYLGQIAENTSRYSSAFQYYEDAEKYLGSEVMYRVTLGLGQARALCALGRYKESADRLRNLKGSMSANATLSLLTLQATTLYGMGAYRDAIAEADQAIREAIARQIPDKEADARAIRMMCYHRLNEDRLAEQDARAIIETLHDKAAISVQGRALILLSSSARSAGNLEDAARYASCAVDLLQSTHASLDLAHALTEQGQVFLAQGNSRGAGVALKNACTEAMKVRRNAPEAYRRDFTDSLEEIFSARIEFLFHKGEIAGAFRAALQLLAKGLTEHFEISGNEALPALDSHTAEFVFLPLKDCSLAVFIRTAGNLTGHLLNADDMRSVVARMWPAFSSSRSALSSDSQAALLENLKNMPATELERGFFLSAHEDSFDSDSESYKDAHKDEGARHSQSVLRGIVDQFREELQQNGDGASTMALSFYSLFFGEEEHRVEKCSRWIICPSGVLSIFPFEALRDTHGQLVMQNHEISYAKSPLLVTEASMDRMAGRGREPSVLAVGDPFLDEGYSVDDASLGVVPVCGLRTSDLQNSRYQTFEDEVKAVLRKGEGSELPRLPGAAREVRSACSITPNSRLLIGRDATKKAFIEALGSRHWDIVHIAVHALYSPESGEGALILFSEGDSILTTSEIAGLSLKADTVVLSACGSALGKMSWTEGSVGLIDAFLRAGVKSVYATLWNIRDDSTAAFMEKVYSRMKSGGAGECACGTFDTALRLSRRQAAEGVWGAEFSTPSLWASFVHYVLDND